MSHFLNFKDNDSLEEFLRENMEEDEVEDFISMEIEDESGVTILVTSHSKQNNSTDVIFSDEATCLYCNKEFYFYQIRKIS